MKDRKILITGASGFIGGFLVEEALRRGYETWAGIRAGSSKAHLQDKRIHFIDLKYGDQEALTAQLSDFAREHGAWDYVIHNAGLTKTLDKRNFFRVNAENTHRFIGFSRRRLQTEEIPLDEQPKQLWARRREDFPPDTLGRSAAAGHGLWPK